MDTTEPYLTSHFRELSDEELMSCCSSQTLTEQAQTIAIRELTSRGLVLPEAAGSESKDAVYEGDYETVARFLNPIDAHIVCSCLQAAGVRAYVADANLMQTNALWSIALGGARIRVPALHAGEAKDIIAAFNRGDFALPHDYDQPSR